jgi:hypothetical protein
MAECCLVRPLALDPAQQERYSCLASDVEAAAKHLAEALNLPEYTYDTRSSVQVDFVAHLLE